MNEMEVAKTFLFAKNLDAEFKADTKKILITKKIGKRIHYWRISQAPIGGNNVVEYDVFQNGAIIDRKHYVGDCLSIVVGRISQLSFNALLDEML